MDESYCPGCGVMGDGSKCADDCERINHKIADPSTQGICFYCRKEVDFNVPGGPLIIEMDHFISKSNSGSNKISNKVISCVPCNRRKGKLNGDQFLKIIREEINMIEPRSYSMPESFMRDEKVPARWRLLGIINGFHISGLPFYASNEWLKAKLNCSEQTITNAVKELEEMNEIRCERTSVSRTIHRMINGRPTDVQRTKINYLENDPSQLGSRPKPVRVNDPSQLGTISYSNSESKLPEFSGENSVPSFKKPKPAKLRAYNESNPGDDLPSVDADGGDPEEDVKGVEPNLLRAYRSMLKWSTDRRGFGFTVPAKQYRSFKAARLANISPTRLKERWEELEQDDFYSTKGFDWTDVVSSFSKRR